MPQKLSVVIPCYRVASQILNVIAGIGQEVDAIYVVDDACPDSTAELVRDKCNDQRVVVLTHDANMGVGGATISGYRRALADGADIVIKLDGGANGSSKYWTADKTDPRGGSRLHQGQPVL